MQDHCSERLFRFCVRPVDPSRAPDRPSLPVRHGSDLQLRRLTPRMSIMPPPNDRIDVSFPRIRRGFPVGDHPLTALCPDLLASPALRRVGTPAHPGAEVIRAARVRLQAVEGFCWVDESIPCIVLTLDYYQRGSDLDLYLDLLHEATHLRQLREGRDVWDEAFAYHRRPTEIEGYAVAVEEARRLGLDESRIRHHLDNPWMSGDEIDELRAAVDAWLAAQPRS